MKTATFCNTNLPERTGAMSCKVVMTTPKWGSRKWIKQPPWHICSLSSSNMIQPHINLYRFDLIMFFLPCPFPSFLQAKHEILTHIWQQWSTSWLVTVVLPLPPRTHSAMQNIWLACMNPMPVEYQQHDVNIHTVYTAGYRCFPPCRFTVNGPYPARKDACIQRARCIDENAGGRNGNVDLLLSLFSLFFV